MVVLANPDDPYVQRVAQFGPYGYQPELAPALLFAIVFFLLTLVHSVVTFKSRVWWTSMLPIACIFECIGNVLRLYGHYQPTQNLNAYIAMQVIVVTTPVFFAATHFTTLAKLLSARNKTMGTFPTRALLPFFLILDIASLAIQGAGAASAAIGEINGQSPDRGGHIVVIGLCLQVFGYVAFDVLALLFARNYFSAALSRGTRLALVAIFVSALLILLRSCFRVGEMSRGWIGPVTTVEWYYYVFDATPVSLAAFILTVAHPSKVLTTEHSVDLADAPAEAAEDNIASSEKPSSLASSSFTRQSTISNSSPA